MCTVNILYEMLRNTTDGLNDLSEDNVLERSDLIFL